jgi:polyferredoxin/tetratricopeptide (TPR) repeat protein
MTQGRCNVAVDVADPLLPVAGTGKLSRVRKSKRSRWRAATLVAVHVAIAAHATQFFLTGRTLSPVEPSESMYTLELGYVNAGFVFFAAALLTTLVFGRFVCGWGCHIVAVQDLCGFIMKKLGVRPRPFRSRLLVWVPLLVALYMFAWPTFKRIVLTRPAVPFPGLSNHLMTTGFWDTFPGPVFAVLTLLTCGFAAVYFLGAKGFCTYGCPYGGLFGVVDRLSPTRIVVNDDCEQCGHCTATCTSNVRVHEEVRLFGAVVDPGCMKCMDCVNVCPKNALRLGFAKPSLFKGKPTTPRARVYTLGPGEELLLGGTFVATTLSFRGLYDGPPLLMAIALGALTAFASLRLWQLSRRPTVRVQNLDLKLEGKLRASGFAFAVLTTAWLAFTAHSGFVQWHRAWGRYHLDRTEATRAEVLGGARPSVPYSERHRRAAAKSFEHFSTADRFGLFDVVEIKLGLAWGQLLSGDAAAAEREIRDAIAVAPRNAGLRDELFDVLILEGKLPEAAAVKEETIELRESASAEEHLQLAGLFAEASLYDQAAGQYRASLALGFDSPELRYNLGGVLRRLGRLEEAIEQLEVARDRAPGDADTRVELGLAYLAIGANDKAALEIERAIALRGPDHPESVHLAEVLREIPRSERQEAAPD